jgi:multiple sugar transport system substrate-binding protein
MRASWIIPTLLTLVTAALLLWPGRDVVEGRKTLVFTVWGMPFEDRLFLDRYARRWEEMHPVGGVRVDYRRYGDDLLMKYNAWHTRGRGAEVMRLRVTDYHGMAARGMLEPLDDYIRDPQRGLSEARLADIPAHLRELLEIDGAQGRHIYALPEDNAQYGLFYNKAIFDKHNQDHPGERVDYPTADWTWEDLRQAARKLTTYDGSGRMTQAGIDFAIWAWPFMTFLAQAGGELWSRDGQRCTVNSPAGVKALEFFRRLQREDRSFNPSLSGYTSGTGPDALFGAGRTAMLLDGSWRVPNLELVAPGLDFAVAPLPRGKVPAVVSGCVLWGISAKAKSKDEAWEFLKWLTEPEQALLYWDTLRVAPPASLGALESPGFRQTSGVAKPGGGHEVPPMPPEHFADRAAWILYANTPHPETGRPPGFVPVHPYQTELEEEITRMLNSYLNPDSTESAQAALDRVVDHVHRIMARDRVAER